MKTTLMFGKILLPNLRGIKLNFFNCLLLLPKQGQTVPSGSHLDGGRDSLYTTVWETTDRAISELEHTLSLLPVILYTQVRQRPSITAQQHQVLT